MGAGKSTLGARLAAERGLAFIDLDALLEAQTGRTIGEQFEHDGEAVFRARELAALQALATAMPVRTVIATGGGIVETAAARPLLRQLGPVVWLHADPEAAMARIAGTDASRPLAHAGAWRERWQRRLPLYTALADHVVSTFPESEAASLAALVAFADARAE